MCSWFVFVLVLVGFTLVFIVYLFFASLFLVQFNINRTLSIRARIATRQWSHICKIWNHFLVLKNRLQIVSAFKAILCSNRIHNVARDARSSIIILVNIFMLQHFQICVYMLLRCYCWTLVLTIPYAFECGYHITGKRIFRHFIYIFLQLHTFILYCL